MLPRPATLVVRIYDEGESVDLPARAYLNPVELDERSVRYVFASVE